MLIAKRHLPWLLAAVHCAVWFALSLVLWRSADARRALVRGYRAGIRQTVPHQPLRWRTLWRMTRLGRPPIV